MKTALETIRDYPINANSDPEAMAQAIEAMQAIAADAIDADTAAKLAPPSRNPRMEQMELFIKSVAALTTPQDAWEADPQLREWYPTPHELGTTYKAARLYGDHCELVTLVNEARKILAGEATADSGHVAPSNAPCRLVIGVRGGCAEVDDAENLPPNMQVFITDYDTNDAQPNDPGIFRLNGDLVALSDWMGADLNALHDGTWGKTVAQTWADTEQET